MFFRLNMLKYFFHPNANGEIQVEFFKLTFYSTISMSGSNRFIFVISEIQYFH